MTRKMHPLCWVGFVLLIVGGLNWGLVGLFNFNLVTAIFGKVPVLERIIYVLVGLSAIGVIVEILGWCPLCRHKIESHTEQPQPQA
ncbi:MAG: DUF378 domain-containing protein [Phycisphaerales bacterium]